MSKLSKDIKENPIPKVVSYAVVQDGTKAQFVTTVTENGKILSQTFSDPDTFGITFETFKLHAADRFVRKEPRDANL